jgi:hypothetical protein
MSEYWKSSRGLRESTYVGEVNGEVKVYFAICDEETLEDEYIQESLERVLESLRTTRDTEGKPLWDGKAEVIWRLATDAEFAGFGDEPSHVYCGWSYPTILGTLQLN